MEKTIYYVKGNHKRGSEVIQELKKLGGQATTMVNGKGESLLYYIENNGCISSVLATTLLGQMLKENGREIKLKEKLK